jgi:hypothetical protein
MSRLLSSCKNLLAAIGAGMLLLAVLTFGAHPIIWRRSTRNESIRLLSEAATPEALAKALGRGMMIYRPDGTWIAIRYSDSHGPTLNSLAIAKDSGGKWHESNYHFCGAFRSHQRLGEMADQSNEIDGSDEIGAHINKLYTAETLEAARKSLRDLGFVEMAR